MVATEQEITAPSRDSVRPVELEKVYRSRRFGEVKVWRATSLGIGVQSDVFSVSARRPDVLSVIELGCEESLGSRFGNHEHRYTLKRVGEVVRGRRAYLWIELTHEASQSSCDPDPEGGEGCTETGSSSLDGYAFVLGEDDILQRVASGIPVIAYDFVKDGRPAQIDVGCDERGEMTIRPRTPHVTREQKTWLGRYRVQQ